MKSITIQPDGTWQVKDEALTLTFLQGEVGGDIESLAPPGCTAYINEEGKLRNLPRNHAAEVVLSALGRPLIGDVLLGPMVVVGPPDEEGNETAIPQTTAALIPLWLLNKTDAIRPATAYEHQEYGWDTVTAGRADVGECDMCGKIAPRVFSNEYDREECLDCFNTKEGT